MEKKMEDITLSEETKKYLRTLEIEEEKEEELNKQVPYTGLAPDRIRALIEHNGTIEDAIETLDMLPEEMGDKIYVPYVLVHLHTSIDRVTSANKTDELTAINIIDEVYHWCDGYLDLNGDAYHAEMKKALADYFAVYPQSENLIANIFKAIDMDPGKVKRTATNEHLFSPGLQISRYKHYSGPGFLMVADDLDAGD